MLGSSFAVQSRDIRSDAAFQFTRADSVELEMVQAQNWAIDLEKLLTYFDKQAKKVKTELRKKNEDLARLEAIEEFKSLEDFEDVVESVTSKYFGEGFDFCKRQLAHHHANLDIYLDGMDMDRDLLEKEEAEAKEKEENKEKGDGEEGDTSPMSP